jgi:hypothetical protein
MWNSLKKIICRKSTLNLKEVFKTGGIPKYTLIDRLFIRSEILETIKNKERALLFLGYSKSGKTVYRKNLFPENQHKTIIFRCNKNSQISDLYNQMSSELNLGQIISTSDSSGIGNTLTTSSTGKIPEIFETSTEISNNINYSYTENKERTRVRVDVNFLCNNIKNKSNLIIILEDYHLVNNDFNSVLS